MRLPINLLLTCGALGLLSGCYTQFATIDPTPRPRPMPDSTYVADSLPGDTNAIADASAQKRGDKDTLVIIDQTDRDRNCYWTRDFWGDPLLKCYPRSSSLTWYTYNTPWWYRNYYDYSYDYDRCPHNYYFDPHSGYCRYYRDFNRYYSPYNRHRSYGSSGSSGGASGGSSGGSTQSDRIQRSRVGSSYGTGTVAPQGTQKSTTGSVTQYPSPQVQSPRVQQSVSPRIAPRPAPEAVQPAPDPAPRKSVTSEQNATTEKKDGDEDSSRDGRIQRRR